MVLGQLDSPTEKKKKLSNSHTSFNLRQIIYLNGKILNNRASRENKREYVHDILGR